MTIEAVEAATTEELLRTAWEAGELAEWLLSPCQLEVYNFIREAEARGDGTVAEIARRYGKSSIFATIAIEDGLRFECLQHYAAPTGKQVKKLLLPVFRELLKTCPEDLRPKWMAADEMFVFPSTGSQIHIAGCEDEGKADRLRGPASHRFFIDEAGFIDVLEYVVKSIAQPQTWSTGGCVHIASTPPKSPAHPFVNMAVLAEVEGRWIHRNIHQSTRYTPKQIAKFCKDAGGPESSDWLREGLALRVVDESRAVVPEFHAKRSVIVGEWLRPQYFDAYVSMDPGQSPSLNFIGLGYYDFSGAMLVIEDEIVHSRPRTDEIAAAVHEREAALWGEHFAAMREHHPEREDLHEPYGRVSDIELQLMNDLSSMHGLEFLAASKTEVDGEAPLNELRIRVKRAGIRINPRCKQLIAHLTAGIWNARRTEYEWIDGLGHLDGIDMLKYMVRHVNYQHNPWPEVPHQVMAGVLAPRYARHALGDREVRALRSLVRPARPS